MKSVTVLSLGWLACCASAASAGVSSFATPAALEAFMGGPLVTVPDDGLPLGTLYGAMGIPLSTPFGPMSFAPTHEKVAPGAYHPFVTFPLAGSDIVAPVGAVAIDFLFTPLFPTAFAITGVGSMTSSDPVVTPLLTPGVPVYFGFGAVGETIEKVTISTIPFGTTPPFTWEVSAIRVLPIPASCLPFALAGLLAAPRRRR